MRRLVCLFSLLVPSLAVAHSGAPFGTHPFLEGDVLIGGGTDYGMLIIEEDGVPYWTCEEAFEFEPNWWFKAPGGPTLAGTFLGLRSSSDGGCTWVTAAGDLASPNMSAVGFDQDDPSHVFVATGDGATTNRVYESNNGGVSFDPTGFLVEGIKPRGIAVADGAGTLWVVAIREVDAVGLVYRSDDGGTTWGDPLELTGWAIPEYRGLSEDQEAIYLSALSSVGGFWLLRVAIDLETPAQAIAEFDAPINALAEFQGDLHVAKGWSVYVTREGEEGDFVEHETGPTRCLDVREGKLWGCGLEPLFPQFGSTSDGQNWETLITYEEVVPRECPVGSLAQELCPAIWELIRPGGDDDDSSAVDDDDSGDDDDDDDGTPPDDDDSAGEGDCDCSAAPRGGAAVTTLCLVGLLLGFRRRAAA